MAAHRDRLLSPAAEVMLRAIRSTTREVYGLAAVEALPAA